MVSIRDRFSMHSGSVWDLHRFGIVYGSVSIAYGYALESVENRLGTGQGSFLNRLHRLEFVRDLFWIG